MTPVISLSLYFSLRNDVVFSSLDPWSLYDYPSSSETHPPRLPTIPRGGGWKVTPSSPLRLPSTRQSMSVRSYFLVSRKEGLCDRETPGSGPVGPFPPLSPFLRNCVYGCRKGPPIVRVPFRNRVRHSYDR